MGIMLHSLLRDSLCLEFAGLAKRCSVLRWTANHQPCHPLYIRPWTERSESEVGMKPTDARIASECPQLGGGGQVHVLFTAGHPGVEVRTSWRQGRTTP